MNPVAVPLLFFGLFASETGQSVPLSLSDGSYSVEVADDAVEQLKGLMGRKNLPANRGMLFVYPTDRIAQLWMKNVPFLLDMIFLDSCGKVVQLHENAIPNDTTIIQSVTPVRAVLELPGGASKRDQIREGDVVRNLPKFFADCQEAFSGSGLISSGP